MSKKKLLLVLAALFVIVAVVLLLRYPGALRETCQRQSHVELAVAYAPLAALLQRQKADSSRLMARQWDQDFMFNLEMSSEQIDLEEVLKMSTQQIEAVATLRQRQRQAFDALCRELVGR